MAIRDCVTLNSDTHNGVISYRHMKHFLDSGCVPICPAFVILLKGYTIIILDVIKMFALAML